MSAPPSGPLPSDTNEGPGLLAGAWILTAVALAFVVARFYSRAIVRHNLGIDDWAMLLAWIFALGTTIVITIEVQNGVGRHIQYVVMDGGPQEISKALELVFISAPFAVMSAGFGKISVALLLLRLMDPNLIRQITLWTIIVLVFSINVVLIGLTFGQCRPSSYLWVQLANPQAQGSCWPQDVYLDYALFQASFSAFTDFFLAVFPITFLWFLQMDLRIKLALIAALSLGAVAGAAAIVKTVELPTLLSEDFTFAAVKLMAWSAAENTAIIIAGCVPTLRPLVMRVSHGWTTRRSRPSRVEYQNEPGTLDSKTGKKYSRVKSPASRLWNSRNGGTDLSKDGDERLVSESGDDLELGGMGMPNQHRQVYN